MYPLMVLHHPLGHMVGTSLPHGTLINTGLHLVPIWKNFNRVR